MAPVCITGEGFQCVGNLITQLYQQVQLERKKLHPKEFVKMDNLETWKDELAKMRHNVWPRNGTGTSNWPLNPQGTNRIK